MGLGSNLFRHAAVGTHDLGKYCIESIRSCATKLKASKDGSEEPISSEEKKAKNFRDIADKVGSIAGAAMGFAMVAYIAQSDGFSALSFNGQKLVESELTKAITSVITVGSSTNYSRNLAVGLHDVIKYSKGAIQSLSGRVQNDVKQTGRVSPDETLPLVTRS